MKSRARCLIFISERRRGRRVERMKGVEEATEANRCVVEEQERFVQKKRRESR